MISYDPVWRNPGASWQIKLDRAAHHLADLKHDGTDAARPVSVATMAHRTTRRAMPIGRPAHPHRRGSHADMGTHRRPVRRPDSPNGRSRGQGRCETSTPRRGLAHHERTQTCTGTTSAPNLWRGHGWATVERIIPDALWSQVSAMLPPKPKQTNGGRKWADDRSVIAGIVCTEILGSSWAQIPATLGTNRWTCSARLDMLKTAGVWESIRKLITESEHLDALNG